MNPEFFASHIGISIESAQELLSLSQSAVYQSALYRRLIYDIDHDLMASVLLEVRALYDAHLPGLVDTLRSEHHHTGKSMTALTLGNWTLGFLHDSQDLDKLPSMHHKVPMPILAAGLPGVLDILNVVSHAAARAEWKKAMALLSLPLFCPA